MATVEELRRLARGEETGPETTTGPRKNRRTNRQGPELSAPVGPANNQDVQAGREFASQFLRGVVNAAAPVARLNPIGGMSQPGAAEIAERSQGIVSTEESTTFPGRIGRMGGVAAGASAPIGGAAATVPRAAAQGGSLLRRIGRGTRNIVSESGRAFRERPGRFVAGESALGGTAGASGLAAERTFPDSDAARITGEILGGVAPQIAPTRLLLKGAGKVKRVITEPGTERGARRRSAAAIQGVQTRSERPRSITELDEPTTLDPQTGRPVLSAPQRSGSQGLLALERSVRESSDNLQREADDQIAQANQVIQQSARDIGQDTAGTIEEAQGYLQSLLDARLRIAARRTDTRINQMGRGASREDANRIAREELENALEAARQQEKKLFGRVEPDTAVPSTNAQSALDRWRSELGKAQQKNIPGEARRLLSRNRKDFLGDTTNIRELRGLQSEMREVARRARSNDRFQQAAIADDIADSITDDLASAGDQSEALQLAVDFSRNFKQRFRRGAVGRIFGREASGGERVREGETLERTIGGGGPGERESLDELRTALTDPEITRLTGTDAEAFNEAAADFVRRRFLERARQEGQFSPERARSFLRDNEQILSRMPDVQTELEQAIRSGRIERVVRQSIEGSDPKVSRTALFIRKGPRKAFAEIADDSPARAGRQTQMLINRAQKDESGRALSGLKAGYVDYIMQPENARDVAGQPFVSGFRLRELRQNPSVQASEKRLLSEAERKRLDTIERDFIRLERARQAPSAGDLPVADKPGKLRQRLARIAGAGVGRQSAAATGSGGTVQIPGQVADIFNDMFNSGFEDPAGRLLRDAVDDERLWRDLLQADIDADGQLPKKASNLLNAWAAGVLTEQGARPEEQGSQAPSVDELRQLAQ